ncbi:MAG: MFS transporter [Nitrospirae bacterium]|nr:MFS transporter [Nitrospirota bacterium]
MFRSSPFLLLCATGLFAIFSSTISKSPVLPLFATFLGADPSGVGLVASVSAFTGIVASIPAGVLSDRWGRKRMLVIAGVVFFTAPFMYMYVTSIWQLALVRFYHGLATAIFVPVGMALVSDLFHAERGEKMGWFSTATLAGRFAAPIVGGSVIGMLANDPPASFKAVYLVCGLTGLAALLLIPGIQSPARENRNGKGWDEAIKELRAVLSHRAIILTAAVEAAILFTYGTFETFLPLYAIKEGLNAYHVGIILSSQVITVALAKPLMGRFSDRHGRRPQIIAGAVLGAACIAAFSITRSFPGILAIGIMFGFSRSVVTSATSAFIADMSSKEGRGSAMGILGSIMDTGHTSGPIISGFIASRIGFAGSFLGAAVVALIAACVFMRGVRPPHPNKH